jgi:subtilisin family serine protease
VLTERIQNFKDKKGIKVIVGIIDSGVDIEHEDLKSYLDQLKRNCG